VPEINLYPAASPLASGDYLLGVDVSNLGESSAGSVALFPVGQLAAYQQWLTVDDTGTYPVVRIGSGGAQYRSAGWNIYSYYPPEGATYTLETAKDLFAQLPPGTLIRTWAYAPVPGSFSWASTIASLQSLVAAAAPYGHRFIFVLSTWGDHNELYNQTGQPDITSNAKTVAWITSQQYLHSVYGSNSLQDWVTAVVTAFAENPLVSVYDIMNEPQDATITNVTAWTTYCTTMAGWIKALAPNALVYMGISTPGNFMGWANIASYATVIASLDLTSYHDYSTAGYSPLFLFDSINKPQILDEHGAWAKGHYGAYTDADLDTNGLPAMSWEAQARYYQMYLETVFRSESTFAALAWSLTAQDSNAGPYGAYNGTGQYEPINQARARKVIHDYPAVDHPYFTPETIGGYSAVLSWINSAQSFRYPDGSVIYTGANALQQQVHDLASTGSFNGPTTSGAGPVCRHESVVIRGQDWPSLQFSAVQYMAGGWQDTGTATYFMVIFPTALPTGAGGTTYGYLVSPTSNTTAAAIRITSTGAVVLEKYSAATGGTVVATSTTTLAAGVPALVMVQFVSGTSYRIDVNTVPLSGTSATTYTATTMQFGAAADATNGFSGHLLEFIKYNVAASEGQISTVNAYLTRKYGLMF